MSNAKPWPPAWTSKNAAALDKWASQQRPSEGAGVDAWQDLLDRAPYCKLLDSHLQRWYERDHCEASVTAFLCRTVLAFSRDREWLLREADIRCRPKTWGDAAGQYGWPYGLGER